MSLTPMITVRDVETTSQWLQSIFSLKSAHGGPEFEMLANGDGQVVLWLHRDDSSHDHPYMKGAESSQLGVGVVLYFQVADIDAAIGRALTLGAEIVEDLHHNPSANHQEFTIKSSDGYFCAAHTSRNAAAK